MAKNLMFVGTSSSAGKSLMATAFCRIFNNDSFKVMPFKSQNMALNSFITKDGKEMGRAQVVQAEAARVEPRVEMNPILLKPTSHMGSQVIIMGKVHSNKMAVDYYKMKPGLRKTVMNAYNALERECDLIIIEGAGSPAEINLKHDDFVNMGLAEMTDSPVILVADIDRGGVFASIYGTIMLLEQSERERIKGFIINKFRGDVELLKPGIQMIEEKVNKPCLGVVPFMDIRIDDEDSVTERFARKTAGQITISVIKLPYISNFTDFTPFEIMDDLRLQYIDRPSQLKGTDLIIIPGSKNTIEDMSFLIESGLDAAIKKTYDSGIPVIGICGGFQILGKSIKDQYNVESSISQIKGLGLLDVNTVMAQRKTTRQFTGKVIKSIAGLGIVENTCIKGYEIHMGETASSESEVIKSQEGAYDGASNKQGTVFGTYVHGFFDNDAVRYDIVNSLRAKKGLDAQDKSLDFLKVKEEQYDKLAENVKKSVDYDKIIKIMGE